MIVSGHCREEFAMNMEQTALRHGDMRQVETHIEVEEYCNYFQIKGTVNSCTMGSYCEGEIEN